MCSVASSSASDSCDSDVDAGRRLVEDEQRRLARERLRDECSLLHSARERADRRVGDVLEADAADRLGDEPAIVCVEPADEPARRHPPGADDLANGRRRVASDLRALREVPERPAAREAVRRLAVEVRRSRGRPLEPEKDAHERRLAATVRPGDGDELSFAEREVDVLENGLARPVSERDASELDR